MEQEKKYVGGWFVWVVVLLVGATIVFAGLSYVGLIGKTVVERKVFENSYQKSEADKTANTTYRAQVLMLRRKLQSPNLDAGTKVEIQAQIDAINIMKSSKED